MRSAIAAVTVVDNKCFAELLRHLEVLDGGNGEANRESLEYLKGCVGVSGDCAEYHRLKDMMTTFSGNTVPRIDSYLERLMRFAGGNAHSCFDVAAILLTRVRRQSLAWAQYLSVDTPQNFVIPTPLLFRLALTSLVLAIKLHSDEFSSMNFYAQVGGVTTAQLLRYETELLELLHYDTHVSLEDYSQFQAKVSTNENLVRQLSAFLIPLQGGQQGGIKPASNNEDDDVHSQCNLSSCASTPHSTV